MPGLFGVTGTNILLPHIAAGSPNEYPHICTYYLVGTELSRPMLGGWNMMGLLPTLPPSRAHLLLLIPPVLLLPALPSPCCQLVEELTIGSPCCSSCDTAAPHRLTGPSASGTAVPLVKVPCSTFCNRQASSTRQPLVP